MAEKKEFLDPRQSAFLEAYLDIKSDTFGNATQSALRVGYGKEYAESIVSKGTRWLSENVGKATMLQKAERNLERALELPMEDKEFGKMNIDVSKFVTSRLGKEKWSERTEITGADGKDLIPENELQKTVSNLKSKK